MEEGNSQGNPFSESFYRRIMKAWVIKPQKSTGGTPVDGVKSSSWENGPVKKSTHPQCTQETPQSFLNSKASGKKTVYFILGDERKNRAWNEGHTSTTTFHRRSKSAGKNRVEGEISQLL